MKAPDTLDQYIQVANPSGWILLASILCLLIGVIVWSAFGTIETKVHAQAFVENETAIIVVSDEQILNIESGMPVRIENAEGTVWKVDPDENTVTVMISVPDGTYDAVIVTETIKPMSLIF